MGEVRISVYRAVIYTVSLRGQLAARGNPLRKRRKTQRKRVKTFGDCHVGLRPPRNDRFLRFHKLPTWCTFSYPPPTCHPERSSHLAAKSKDLFAFREGISNLLSNRSLDYARDDSLVRNLQLLDKLPISFSVAFWGKCGMMKKMCRRGRERNPI